MRYIAPVILALSLGLSAQGRDPVAGAWEQLPNPAAAAGQGQNPPPHVIYANGHYVQFTASAGRAKLQKPTAEMTREELLDRYRMQGQYGTYRIDGTRLIRMSIAAANPNNEGREFTYEFRVDGDTLILTTQNAQGQPTETRYRRLK